MTRHSDKGSWESSQSLDQLGVHIGIRNTKLHVAERKVRRVRGLAKQILLLAQRNMSLVSLRLLRHFCRVCVSLTISLPLLRFHTRSMYFDMSISMQETPGRRGQQLVTKKVGLCRQSFRDLRYWRTLTRGEGRELHHLPPQMNIHIGAVDVGYGGTLGYKTVAGSPGLWEGQGFWKTEERKQLMAIDDFERPSCSSSTPTPTFCRIRLRASRETACRAVSELRVRRRNGENRAVVAVLNAMVSASRPIMVELWKLEVLMRLLGVKIEAKRFPSAVNRIPDSFSKKWDPGDDKAEEDRKLLQSTRKLNPQWGIVLAEIH